LNSSFEIEMQNAASSKRSPRLPVDFALLNGG
jgi:hypothetical protein